MAININDSVVDRLPLEILSDKGIKLYYEAQRMFSVLPQHLHERLPMDALSSYHFPGVRQFPSLLV